MPLAREGSMSSKDFDGVFEGLSHDELFDRGWTEVPISQETRAKYAKPDIINLAEQLQELYWKGAEREIANAILAFDEIQSVHPEETEEEKEQTEQYSGLMLDGEKDKVINEWLKIWNPLGNKVPEDVSAWTIKFAIAAYLNKPLPQRRARSLLQAIGFLDIDYCREYRPPSLRSWGQRPHVEVRNAGVSLSTRLLVAVQCSQCRYCIRSLVFYKCVKGCKDHSVLRNRFKLDRKEGESLSDDEDEDDLNMSYSFLMEVLDEPADYRICPGCLKSCTHSREHLRAVRQYHLIKDPGVEEFSQELDAWEDMNTGKSLLALGSATWEHFVENAQKSSTMLPATRTMFPAGDTHTVLMFGPLLIENGVTKKPGGAFISLRNLPSLSNKTPEYVEEFLAEEKEFRVTYKDDGSPKEELLGTCCSVAPNKKIYQALLPRRRRSWLSFRKQVLGGMFTGYTPEFDAIDSTLLESFLEVAENWASKKSTDNSPSQNSDALKSCAKRMTDLLKTAYQHDVLMNLTIFSERLLKRVKLNYSRISNNCQQFCKSLLINGDYIDKQFDSLYPVQPSFIEQTAQNRCLRYLMSFAGTVADPVPFGGKANIMATAVKVFDWFPHTDGADIIDHIASLRFKMDQTGESPDFLFSFDEGDNPYLHDELLLKTVTATCLFKHVNNRECSLTTHLLDCPYDNLSLLAMHVHRSRRLYTVRSDNAGELGKDIFLSTKGSKSWISNRLGVLLRTFLLQTYLRSFVMHFFGEIPDGIPIADIPHLWNPQPSSWARGRHDSVRTDEGLVASSQGLENSPGNIEGHTGPLVQLLKTSAPFMQSEAVFKRRWRIMKDLLRVGNPVNTTDGNTPWTNCECRSCNQARAVMHCRRAKAHATDVTAAEGQFNAGHPDYTPMVTIQWAFARLQGHKDKMEAEGVLVTTPEYFKCDEKWRP
ncbi:hypothetical protein VTL71DRAFT_6197 [Oculimacula yallundae]|uniref:Uncharacterized protein n=1 Tax=Oculimacula yallundae TaxID=86028 RepID=A0ABR4BZU1_9HELO